MIGRQGNHRPAKWLLALPLLSLLLGGCMYQAGTAEQDSQLRTDGGTKKPKKDGGTRTGQSDGGTDAEVDAEVPGPADPTLRPAPDCRYRMLGYGLISRDDQRSGDDRKSGTTCVIGYLDGMILQTRNPEATTCVGDSGGPLLLDGTNYIAGVLRGAWLPSLEASCVSGMDIHIRYNSVAVHRDWIDQVLQENTW